MRRLGLVVLAAVAACSLPKRDNPHEPSQQPQAELYLIRAPGVAPDCTVATWPAPDAVEVVGAAFRGDCLALDARRTRDPRGLSYDVAFRGPDDAPLAADPSAPAGILPLTLSYLRTLAIDSALTFSVAVDNHVNPPAMATTQLIVKDHAPTVGTGFDRTLPAGGYPWSLGTSFSISLHADGADADPGDDGVLSYCWTIPPAAEACGQPADVTAIFPVDRARYEVSVRAEDGPLSSAPAKQFVTVGTPNVWAQGDSFPNSMSIELLDANRQTWTSPSSVTGSAFLDGAKPVIASLAVNADSSLTFEARGWPRLDALPGGTVNTPYVLQVSPDRARLAAATAQRTIWASGMLEPATRKFLPTLFSYSVSADGAVSAAIPIATPWGPESATNVEEPVTAPLVAADAAGNGWASRSFGYQVYSMTPQGQPYAVPLPTLGIPGGIAQVHGLASRPGSGEVWALARFKVGSPSGPAFLIRYSAPGDAGTPVVLTDALMLGLEFVDHDRAWVFSGERGLLLLDVSALEAGADQDSATLLTVPDAFLSIADGIAIDPITQDAWVRDDLDDKTWRVGTDGSVEVMASAASVDDIDPSGIAWFRTGNIGAESLQSGRATPADGVIMRSLLARGTASAYVWQTGGTWAPFPDSEEQVTGGYVELDQAGVPVRSFGSMLHDGTLVRPPDVASIAASSDGSALWIVGRVIGGIQAGMPNEIWAVDLSTDPPTARLALPTNARYRKAIEPLAGDPHHAFTIRQSFTAGTQSSVTILGDDASDVSIFDIPLAEYNPGTFTTYPLMGARSLRSDKLCTFSVDGGANTAHVRRFDRAGTMESVLNFGIAATWSFPLIAASGDGSIDVCWIVLHDSSGTPTDYLYAFEGGTTRHFWSQSESPVVSLLTSDPQHVWVGLANGHHLRLDWPDAATFSPAVTSIGTSEATAFGSR